MKKVKHNQDKKKAQPELNQNHTCAIFIFKNVVIHFNTLIENKLNP